jgi:hypothetical protein
MPRAQDQPLRLRPSGDALDRVGRHPQVEWDKDEPCPNGAVVRRGELRRRRRPREDPVARLEAGGTEAPRRESTPPCKLPVRPAEAGPLPAIEPQSGPIAKPPNRDVEEVQESGHRTDGKWQMSTARV